MARRQVPEKLLSVLKDIGLTERESIWDCHGTPVVLHKALEKIASFKRITFSEPTIIHSDPKEKICILNVSGSIGDRSEWSIGEATPYNNKNAYPYAMAEKRAKDRVILKLIDIAGDVYSEEEADDFKASRPDKPPNQEMKDITPKPDDGIEEYNKVIESTAPKKEQANNLEPIPDVEDENNTMEIFGQISQELHQVESNPQLSKFASRWMPTLQKLHKKETESVSRIMKTMENKQKNFNVRNF